MILLFHFEVTLKYTVKVSLDVAIYVFKRSHWETDI